MRAIRVLAVNTGLSILFLLIAGLVLAADRLWPSRLPGLLAVLSWPLFVGGTLLILSALVAFIRFAHASGAPGDAPTRLVTGGPFRFVRNPIYIGAALLLFAVAFYRQSPSFLVVTVALLPGIDTYVRRVEEPQLEARFGEAYIEYKRSVPRWIPRWPTRQQAG